MRCFLICGLPPLSTKPSSDLALFGRKSNGLPVCLKLLTSNLITLSSGGLATALPPHPSGYLSFLCSEERSQQPGIRRVLVAKCQGLSLPPVVFTSSSSLLFQTPRPCCLQASGLLACPPWHVASLKCSFDGTFVQHNNEGCQPPSKPKDARTQITLCVRTSVCTNLSVLVPAHMNLWSYSSAELLFIRLFVQKHVKEAFI